MPTLMSSVPSESWSLCCAMCVLPASRCRIVPDATARASSATQRLREVRARPTPCDARLRARQLASAVRRPAALAGVGQPGRGRALPDAGLGPVTHACGEQFRKPLPLAVEQPDAQEVD